MSGVKIFACSSNLAVANLIEEIFDNATEKAKYNS